MLRRYLGLDDFRIVHLSIQENHLHLLVEANDGKALTRRMQSFAINAPRAINKACNYSGKVFAFRYHATQILTPRQARRSLAYVLNNWRHHRQDFDNSGLLTAKLDAFSTAISFTGWIGRPRWTCPQGYEPLPCSSPQTDLLARSWSGTASSIHSKFQAPSIGSSRETEALQRGGHQNPQ